MRWIINLTCKYAKIDSVLNKASKGLADIIMSAPLTYSKDYITVDVKKQHLDIGKYTCIPGWYSDSIADPDPIHHLIVFGYNTTEFKRTGRIECGEWKTYGLDLHRGPRVTIEETRVLIRLTESNVIKGNTKINLLK